MAMLEIKGIQKSFGKLEVLKGVDLKVNKGDVVAILGPSGSGKTTLLRCINFLETATGGTLTFDGEEFRFGHISKKDIARLRKKTAFVFQSYNLFLNKTALQNVTEGLIVARKIPKAQAEETGRRCLDKVGLSDRYDYYPSQLSGGQQQRVAIARALANEPKVLLLDEPLGALDLKLRKDMQVELKKIQQQTGITFIFVTHDQEEALSMSDTVVVMDGGVIQQIGTPTDIYNEPQNAFVADFIGESNILDGVMREDYQVKFAGRSFRCLDSGFEKNAPVDVVIRPEDIDVVEPDSTHITGEVTAVTFKGVHYEIIVDVAGFKWMIQSTDFRQVGDRIGLSLTPDDIHVMAKSEYSGMFGDYSTFSDEMEEDITASEEAQEAQEGEEDEI